MLPDALGHAFDPDLRCRNHGDFGACCSVLRTDHLHHPEPCPYPGPPVTRCTENLGEVKSRQTEMGEAGIVVKMISDAVRDLKSRLRSERESAQWFLFSPESRFDECCDWIGMDADILREGLRRKMRDNERNAA